MEKYAGRLLAILLCFWTLKPLFATADKNQDVVKISRPGVYQGYSVKQYKGFSTFRGTITMRDSVLIAADIFLPKHLEKGKKVPTILYLTRYVRTIQAKSPLNLLKDPIFGDTGEEEIRFFTSYGYACIIVDVRGTGASTGARKMEFSAEEVADGNEIVNWIAAQGWSDGQVASTGVSYVGTTAELLLANKNPHVKACIARSNIFDLYDDMVFPDGVCQGPFIELWGKMIQALDYNNFKPLTKQYKLILGIHPVKGDKGRKIWKVALAMHKKNFDVAKSLGAINFRDDIKSEGGMTGSLNDFSIHTRLKDIQASGTPIYRMDGWYDAGLAKGCIDAWLNTSNTKKMLIGPWDHGPQADASPFATDKHVKYNINIEMLRFFDHYLKGIDNGIDKEPVFTYYTVGAERWNTSSTWPVPGNLKTMYFSSDLNLTSSADKVKTGKVNYRVDYTTTTGSRARWNSLAENYLSKPTDYPDRRKEDEKLLSFTSEALGQNMDLTGAPVVHLDFAADSADATVFCYLEDVGPDSTVTYVTEGMFRLVHSKTCDQPAYKTIYPSHSYCQRDAKPYQPGETAEFAFDMLPISYRFKSGHRIRLSFAGTDVGHFNLPSPRPSQFTFIQPQERSSFIELPVVTGTNN